MAFISDHIWFRELSVCSCSVVPERLRSRAIHQAVGDETSELNGHNQQYLLACWATKPIQHWFLLGAGLDIWLACQSGTALGSLLGPQVPAAWHVEFAATLTFLALLVLSLRDRGSWGAALLAGGCAVLAGELPGKLGLLIAIGVGMLVGRLLEARTALQPKGQR